MKKKLSLFLAAFIAATVFTVRAAVQANDPVTLTWDFSEEQFNWTTPDTLQIPDEGLDYRGMLLKMKFTPNAGIKDFVSKIGFRPNGASTTDNRYIQYIPEYDGKLTVYYASNNATATDRITAVGTAIKKFTTSDAVPTEVIAYGVTEGSTVKSFTADLTKGTTYYIYLANGGQRISKLEFTYTPTPDPQPAEGETTTTTFDFTSSEFISGLGLTVPAAGKTTYIEEAVTYDKVTLTPIKCSSNWPGIYSSNGVLSFRIYKLANDIKGGAQFSVSNGTVDKIVITGNTQLANVTASNGTIEMSSDNKTLTWTKAAGESPASVVFYYEGSSSTLTISTIDVTKTIVGGDIPETTYGIVGDLTGGWEVDAEMKKAVGADGVYTLVVKDFEAKAGTKYEYKLRANKSWDGYQLPAGQENFTWTPDADGTYTLTFTANINENTLDLVATKTSINTVAELNKLENNATFKFVGNAIVVAAMTKATKNGTTNYVYIKDETGSSLIYDAASEKLTADLGVGNVITAPWTGKVSIYNNLFEAIPTVALGATSTVQVVYPEASATDVIADNANQVVLIKGLTIASVNGNNINFTIGNAAVPGYNQFGIELPAETEGKTFDVVGAISVYNQNVQFQPITITEAQEPQPEETIKIYLKPGIWAVDNARFAANALSREDTQMNEWCDFVATNDEGYYMAEIPAAATMVRLYRFDPTTTENSANPGAFWNRTDVIVLNANTNLYKITAWPEAEGGNCAYAEATYPETLYNVNIAEVIENGSVATNVDKAAEGDKVTVITKPAEGYELDAIKVSPEKLDLAVVVAEDGTFTMPADNVTVSATFKEKAAPQPTVEKLYIIGNGTANEWNNTTEVTFNEQTSAFEYEITAKADCYIAFGDAELNNDWDTFNGSHRYALEAGKNVVPTIGEALQLILTQGEGCVLLAPGYKYALSVTKDLKLTVTREELPAQKFTASFSNTGNWAEVWAYTFSKDAEGQQTKELGEWPGTKLNAGEDGIFNVEIETSVAPQYIVFNNGVQGDGMIKTENLKFENGKSYEYIPTQTFSVSFKTGKNWDKVYAYTFNPVLSGEWPGTEITSTLAEGVYTYAFEAVKAPEFIIFNNGYGGEGNQTADLEFEDGKAYEYGVEPTPEGIVYDFVASGAAAETLTKVNLNFQVNMGEGKEDRTNRDFRGYKDYAGTILPAECQVALGEEMKVDAQGLIVSQNRYFAVYGLHTGDKVTIIYSGVPEGSQPAYSVGTSVDTNAKIGENALVSPTSAINSGDVIEITKAGTKNYIIMSVFSGMRIEKVYIQKAALYNVTKAESITNGDIKLSATTAAAGDEVTVTATPAEGYELEAITVTCVNIDLAVIVTDGKFIMPADDVTVNATFKIATGINNIGINADAAGEKDVYYNLQGVRVENPGKGLYIKNGKKVLVK